MTKLTPWAAAAATAWAAATTNANRRLNALLVEMDGFDTQEGIIIIAATNRPDVLDPALLRPGRFDRQVMVNLPDVRGREGDFEGPRQERETGAGGGFVRHRARHAGLFRRGTGEFAERSRACWRRAPNKKAVGMAELEEARDKVRWGRERRSMAMTDEEKKCTAWHEAGHALVNVLLEAHASAAQGHHHPARPGARRRPCRCPRRTC